MKLKPTENQYRWGIVAFLVLAATSLFVAMLLNLGSIWGSIKTIISLLVPFIIGFAIAYLLNPIMKFWEEKVLKKIKKPQTRRTLSLLITYAAFLLLLGGAISYVAPRLISSITSLANEIPGYYNTFVKDATDFIEAHPSINQLYTRYEMQIHSFLEQCVSFISGYLGELVPKIANVTMKVGSGLINTYAGMILPFIAGSFGVFLCRQYYVGFPRELDDAATVDGCGRVRAFFRIYLPLSKPVLASLGVLKFTGTWNEYTWPLIMARSDSMKTVQVALTLFRNESEIRWNLMMAATIMISLAVYIVFGCAQKHFVNGILAGSIKG